MLRTCRSRLRALEEYRQHVRRPPDQISLLDCAVLIAKHAYPQLVGTDSVAHPSHCRASDIGAVPGSVNVRAMELHALSAVFSGPRERHVWKRLSA